MVYLNDTNFLLNLDKQKNKTIFARITALNFQEAPIDCIEGSVTTGSINVDGTSAVRRTCSLSIVTTEEEYHDYIWALNTKFKLEVGVINTINNNYPETIWFPQGIFILNSISTSKSTSNFTISLQGKDKMCLLNGEVGGTLESTVDFGTIEEENSKGEWVTRKIPIVEIIRNAVHVYGGEPYHNIIINDLDTYGLELLEYRYDVPMYMYHKADDAEDEIQYSNILIENDCLKLYDINGNEFLLKDLTEDHLESLVVNADTTDLSQILYTTSNHTGQGWKFTKINYGETAGYRLTDLTYAGDLIANAGESLTSILDKIKNMLVEFEYFYNLQGQFVFQKKQSFISTMWNTNDSAEIINKYNSHNSTYTFTNNESVISFNNNPNLLNMKNDYVIWGERSSTSGATIPIHLRYAIDTKVTQYTQITVSQEEVNEYNEKYETLLPPQLTPKTFIASDGEYTASPSSLNVYCDWREVLYQMAMDYYRYNFLDDFQLRVANANYELYPSGQTGYEHYYADMQGFWRQIFNPELEQNATKINEKIEISQSLVDSYSSILNDSSDENGIKVFGLTTHISALSGLISDYEAAKTSQQSQKSQTIKTKLLGLQSIYPNYCPSRQTIEDTTNRKDIVTMAKNILLNLQEYYRTTEKNLVAEKLVLNELTAQKESFDDNIYNFYDSGIRKYWCKDVFEAPDMLNFWFDFLDKEGELDQFNVKLVGVRTKTINDSLIKSIYFRETPQVIFQEADTIMKNKQGFKTIQIGNIDNMFSVSAQGKSAKDKLDELLYTHGYCIESATITTVPIYYLQPNIRIHINDNETNVNGDYIVSKFTIPLAYNGTMSITATKAVDNLM